MHELGVADEYFDCADHTTILTHVAVEEHLVAAGLVTEQVVPRFMPYSFRSRLPSFEITTRLYLRFPTAWKVLGKQFLLWRCPPDRIEQNPPVGTQGKS